MWRFYGACRQILPHRGGKSCPARQELPGKSGREWFPAGQETPPLTSRQMLNGGRTPGRTRNAVLPEWAEPATRKKPLYASKEDKTSTQQHKNVARIEPPILPNTQT